MVQFGSHSESKIDTLVEIHVNKNLWVHNSFKANCCQVKMTPKNMYMRALHNRVNPRAIRCFVCSWLTIFFLVLSLNLLYLPWMNDNYFSLLQMMLIFIKAADVSNEARPMDVAEPWLECLLQEFFNQVIKLCYALSSCLWKRSLQMCIFRSTLIIC